MRRAGMRARWAAALLGAALLAGVLPLSMAVAEEPGQTGNQAGEVSVEPRVAAATRAATDLRTPHMPRLPRRLMRLLTAPRST